MLATLSFIVDIILVAFLETFKLQKNVIYGYQVFKLYCMYLYHTVCTVLVCTICILYLYVLSYTVR